jgi:hypothetical protein
MGECGLERGRRLCVDLGLFEKCKKSVLSFSGEDGPLGNGGLNEERERFERCCFIKNHFGPFQSCLCFLVTVFDYVFFIYKDTKCAQNW